MEAYGSPSPGAQSQPNIEVWSAPFTDEPSKIATTAVKVATLPTTVVWSAATSTSVDFIVTRHGIVGGEYVRGFYRNSFTDVGERTTDVGEANSVEIVTEMPCPPWERCVGYDVGQAGTCRRGPLRMRRADRGDTDASVTDAGGSDNDCGLWTQRVAGRIPRLWRGNDVPGVSSWRL
ncbi:hypothetical protein BH09MYX1_BH09MYX1_40250 [soil metagenome]